MWLVAFPLLLLTFSLNFNFFTLMKMHWCGPLWIVLNYFLRINVGNEITGSKYIYTFVRLDACMCSVTRSCLTLCGLQLEDCSPQGSSSHGISQARILDWGTISYSKGSSWPRDQTHVSCTSCIGRQILYHYCHLGSPKD